VREAGDGLVAGGEAPAWLTRLGDLVARAVSSVGLERSARLAAAAVVPLLLPDDGLVTYAPLLAGLSAYVLLTALASRDRYLRAADLVVAAGLLVTTGPAIVAFLPFVLVTIAGPASKGGVRAGLAAGGTLALVLLVRLLVTGEFGDLGAANVIPISLLLPLAGLTAAAASDVLQDRGVRDRMVLQQANRLLSSLRDLADEIPGGLDVTTVSAALLAELRGVPGVEAALVLVEDHGMLRSAAATGMGDRPVPPIRVEDLGRQLSGTSRFHAPSALPPALRPACTGHPDWIVLALGEAHRPAGVLLVGFDLREPARRARPRLSSLAGDGRLALENARLFDGTRVRAADAARRNVAGDLHDGVAQSLAHLRIELELRARDADQDPELARLARVADTALLDLRATIAGLRAPLDHDLGALLERHIDDLQSPRGPSIEFRREGANRLDPERAEEVLRVAQEALSNALRHASAETIEVFLVQDDDEVRLVVRDDGTGPGRPSPHGGGGIGLRSMRERAERLHGELELERRPDGGSRVALTLPTTGPTGRPAGGELHHRRRTDRAHHPRVPATPGHGAPGHATPPTPAIEDRS
jgi:signal transduction histidine kinase